jgi:regulator of nonsense transcripts 2
LIYVELTKVTAERVLKLLRKLDWDSGEVKRSLDKIFFKIWKVRFGNIPMMAFLVAELSVHHPELSVRIVDGILEEVRMGLEVRITL